MVEESFYRAIAPLGENAVVSFKRIENALIYIIGQIAIFDVDKNRFFYKEKSRFEKDLNRSRGTGSPVPTEDDLMKFSMHIKLINESMVGRGVRYEMIVSNSLLKLFFE